MGKVKIVKACVKCLGTGLVGVGTISEQKCPKCNGTGYNREKKSMRKYQIIYADPPWSYSYMGSVHGGRGQKQHYQCMRCVDIYDLPIEKISDDNCSLFLWATFPMLPEALHTIKSWGFTYKTIAFVWIKLNSKSKTPFFGMGHWTRTNAEVCLLGIRGDIKRQNADVSQIIMSSRENHSRKPSEIRERIIRLMGDLPRIELFARKSEERLFEDESFEGWNVWGNEVESDINFEEINDEE